MADVRGGETFAGAAADSLSASAAMMTPMSKATETTRHAATSIPLAY